MKKLKVLAACLIAAVVLTGASYAIWASQMNIFGTVNTGQLGLEWDETYCSVAPFDRNLADGTAVTCSIDKTEPNRVIVTVANLYPGAGINLDVLGRNNGTIPVKFKDAKLTFSGDTELVPYLKSWGIVKWNTDGTSTPATAVSVQTAWQSFSTFASDMNALLPNFVLKPGGWFSMDQEPGQTPEARCIAIKLDENAPPELTMNKTVTFVLETNFEQAQ